MTSQNSWDAPSMQSAGDGKLLVGVTGSRPVLKNLSGCGMTVANGPGTIAVDTISTGKDYVKISTATASGSTSIDFTGLSSAYFMYIIECVDFVPASDGAVVWLRTSTDNGVSFDSGASDYTYGGLGADNDGNLRDNGTAAATHIQILGRSLDPLGNNTDETHSVTIHVIDPSNAHYTRGLGNGEFVRTNGDCWFHVTAGQRLEAAAVDAVRIILSNGNISSGKFTLYGAKA